MTRKQKWSQQWTLATTATGSQVELLLDGMSGGVIVPQQEDGVLVSARKAVDGE